VYFSWPSNNLQLEILAGEAERKRNKYNRCETETLHFKMPVDIKHDY
jgi:hypothetical protein